MANCEPLVFFSYAREDSAFALILAKDLKAAGLPVWLDQLDISPGRRWDRAIEEALALCPRMLVVLSPAAVNSNNVMDEVSYALEENKTIIPVLYKDCKIPFRLRRLQYADFRSGHEVGVAQLLRTLPTTDVQVSQEGSMGSSGTVPIFAERAESNSTVLTPAKDDKENRLQEEKAEAGERTEQLLPALDEGVIPESKLNRSSTRDHGTAATEAVDPRSPEPQSRSGVKFRLFANLKIAGSIVPLFRTARVILAKGGSALLTHCQENTSRLWDCETGRQILTLQGHSDSVTCVAVIRNGLEAVSGGIDGTVRKWDLNTGKQVSILRCDRDQIRFLAVARSGCVIVTKASAATIPTIRFWDLSTSKETFARPTRIGSVSSLAVTPDGTQAIIGFEDGSLQVIKLASGESSTFIGHKKAVTCIALAREGRTALTGSNDHTVGVWDLRTGKAISIFRGHTARVNSVAATSNGMHAFSASHDATVRMWDITKGEIHSLQHDGAVTSIGVLPDRNCLLSGARDKTLRLWDLDSGSNIASLHTTFEIDSCEVSSNGIVAAVGSRSGCIARLPGEVLR